MYGLFYVNIRFLLNDIVPRVVLLVDLPRNSGHEFTSVGFTESKERISLVLGEELVPLLQELVQVVGHVIVHLGQFVAEGESWAKLLL